MLPQWWKKHFLFVELLLSILLIILFYIVVQKMQIESRMMDLVKNNRSAIYTLIASISGSLLGFTFTGIAILLALADNQKLGILTQSKHYSKIYKVYISTIKILAITTILSLVSLIYDHEGSPKCIMLYLNLWAVILVCFRLLRCLWILEKIILIANKPPDSPADNA